MINIKENNNFKRIVEMMIQNQKLGRNPNEPIYLNTITQSVEELSNGPQIPQREEVSTINLPATPDDMIGNEMSPEPIDIQAIDLDEVDVEPKEPPVATEEKVMEGGDESNHEKSPQDVIVVKKV